MNEGIDFCDLVGRLSACLPPSPSTAPLPLLHLFAHFPERAALCFPRAPVPPPGLRGFCQHKPSFLREKAADCDMAGKIELTLALSRTRWTVVSTRVRFECIPSCLGFISTRQHFQSHLTFLKPSAHAVREKYSERVLSY